MQELMLMQLVVISIASILCQWVAWRTHTPAIIFLLIAGFTLGPVLGAVQPNLLLGDLFHPLISIAVALILFEGSLQLQLREIRKVHSSLLRFVLVGAGIGWVLISLAAYYVAGLSLPVAVTFGGLLIVTGPTVIMPLLRHAKLQQRVGSMLKWEGIINDSVGVIFAVLALEYFIFTSTGTGDTEFFLNHGIVIAIISIASVGIGWLCGVLFEKGFVPEYLKSPFLIALVIITYALCDVLMHESGLIAVTLLGLTLTNVGVASIEDIRKFKEVVSVLLVSGVFILLTADLQADVLLQIDFRGALFIVMLLFFIRPLTVFAATIRGGWSKEERMLAGWIAPRGVVCAAVAGIMGPRLVDAGFADGEKLLPMAFGLVIASVTLHGLTVKPLARFLGLAAEKGHGLLIVGCNAWTIQLAETLKQRDMRVRIVDTEWQRLRTARLANIPVYYGEVLSEEAEFEIGLNQYDVLLVATGDAIYNALVCNTFAAEYGRENVYQVNIAHDERHERQQISETLKGRIFLAEDITYSRLLELFYQGWRFRTMRIGADKKAQKDPYEPSKTRKIAGLMRADGRLSLAGGKISVEGKEDDIAILFEKEEAKREGVKEKVA